jgi:hypothetical protein
MIMKLRAQHTIGLLAAAMLIASAGPASAQTGAAAQVPPSAPSSSIVEGVFRLAGNVTDNTGSQQQVGKYDLLSNGVLPQTELKLWGDSGSTRFDVSAWFGGESHYQRYSGLLDFNRIVKADVSYGRFPHRLGHDTMWYVDSASGIGGTFVVRHTDTDPTAAYQFDYGDLNARLEFAIPQARGLKLFVSHRQQTRDGHHQSLTTNHCSNCHTVGYTRTMEQKTRDLVAGLRWGNSRVAIDYSVLNRAFREDAAALTHVYDRAVHPATLQDVFYNRVIYDQRDGAQAFDTTPGADKTTHTVNARVALPNDGSLTGLFVRSSSTNTDLDLKTTYTGGSGRFAIPINKQLTFRGSLRAYDIESDSIFVDIPGTVSPAGPTAGLTYEQAYPTVGELSFLRESSLSRSPTDFSLELAYQPFKRTTLRVAYDWESVTRDHFEVEKTTTQSVRVAGRGRVNKTFDWRFRFDQDWVTDPFTYEHAAIPQTLQPYPSPGNLPFTGLQYFTMYRSRQADLTAFPTAATFVDGSATWSPAPRVSVTGHYRYRTASNDDLNFSTWDNSAHTPGFEAWIAPGDRWSLMAGYTYQRQRLETMFSTLAFGG